MKLIPRLREKRLTEMQISLLKWIALILIFPNNLIIIAYGKFDNEFLRISVTIGVGLHVYYTDLHWIVRIIVSKHFSEKVRIFPFALSNHSGFNLFKMNDPVWGGALSTFGEDYDQNGIGFKTSFEYSIAGVSADKVVEFLSSPKPDYIKIDVDGIEHLILNGGKKVLIHVKSILIESSNNFLEQTDGIKSILTEAGFELVKEVVIDNNYKNQIWNKKNYTI